MPALIKFEGQFRRPYFCSLSIADEVPFTIRSSVEKQNKTKQPHGGLHFLTFFEMFILIILPEFALESYYPMFSSEL